MAAVDSAVSLDYKYMLTALSCVEGAAVSTIVDFEHEAAPGRCGFISSLGLRAI
jgi:hypothetical protein